MGLIVRLACVFAVGAIALDCGARTEVAGGAAGDAGASFPTGTYTHCAFGTVALGPFLIPAGFDGGATLVVTQQGDERTATYVDGNGRVYAWTFTTTTSNSAVLAPNAQSTDGFGSAICVYGIGVSNEKFFPTTFDATAGAMTYESGAVFLSMQGELTSHADCGEIAAPASVWIGCTNGPAPAISAPAAPATFPNGDFACTSQIGTHTTVDGKNTFITSGATGTLAIAQSGASVSAQYTGDAELTGALDFTLSAASTGAALAGQSLTARCDLGPATGELSVSAASLAAIDGTVFMSVAGTLGASGASGACQSGEMIATLVCATK